MSEDQVVFGNKMDAEDQASKLTKGKDIYMSVVETGTIERNFVLYQEKHFTIEDDEILHSVWYNGEQVDWSEI